MKNLYLILILLILFASPVLAVDTFVNHIFAVNQTIQKPDGTCGKVTSIDPWTVQLCPYRDKANEWWNGHYIRWRSEQSCNAQSIVWMQTVTCNDSDNDGIIDENDVCSGTAPGTPVNSTGCPDEPINCTDGEITGDEEGYDCGGSCALPCVATCKEGTVPYEDPSGTRCIQEVPTDNYGNCPNLTEWYYYPASESSNAFCSKVTDPYLGKTVVTLPGAVDPWKKEITTTTTGSVSVVDNGDGTSTKTETSLATGTDGKTTQSTTTSTINNTTGDTINKSSVNQFITTNPDNAWSEDAKLIVEAVNNLKEEIDPNALTNISTASDLASTGAADGMLDAVSLEFDTIADEYENEMDAWIKPETITTTGKSLLPTPVSGCTDFTFSMSDGRSIKTISCDALYKIRAMLDMVFALLLFMYLYALVFQEDIVKGG